MHVAILWTINDFPTYGNLSWWVTKGKLACPICNKDTFSLPLQSRLCYMDYHHILNVTHPCCKNKRAFNGKVENRIAPNILIVMEY